MMATAGKASSLESARKGSITECSICLEELQDPRMLSCSHTFCKGCLTKHVTSSATVESPFSCPVCRQDCVLTKEDNQVRESSALVHNPQQQIPCINIESGHEHGEATKFCKECAEYYCEDCANGHSRYRATREHKLLLAGDVSEEEVSEAVALFNIPKCKKHPREDFTIYCHTCKVPICTVCCISKHKEHRCQELMEAAAEFKSGMETAVEETKPHLASLVADLRDLEVTEGKIQVDIKEARQLVDKHTDQLIQELRKQRKDLHTQITLAERATRAQVEAAKNERHIELSKVQGLHSLVGSLKTDYDKAVSAPVVREKLLKTSAVSLLKKCVQWRSDIFNSSFVTLPTNMIGTINTNHKEPRQEYMYLTFTAPALKMIALKSNNMVTGLATTGKHVYVAQLYQKQVSIFTPDGRYVASIDIPGLRDPQGLAVVKKAAPIIVISNHKSGQLHFGTLSGAGNELVSHTFEKLKYTPAGVSIISADGETHILVSAPELSKVFVHGVNGVVLKELDLSAHVSMKGLVYAEKCSTGYLITDCKTPQVLLISEQGDILKAYNGRMRSSEQPGYATAYQAIHDSKNSVFIADHSSHRLHWLAPDFTFKDYILDENCNIYRPKRICLDESAQLLYVGHDRERCACVDIYQYSYEPKS